jgi:hypothetical protein
MIVRNLQYGTLTAPVTVQIRLMPVGDMCFVITITFQVVPVTNWLVQPESLSESLFITVTSSEPHWVTVRTGWHLRVGYWLHCLASAQALSPPRCIQLEGPAFHFVSRVSVSPWH